MMRTYCFSFLILACVSELCIFGISVSSVPQRSPCVCTSICAHTEYVCICCACIWTTFKCMCMCVCVCKMCVTSRSDRGVLSPSGRCCSRARTMQFAMMVVRIIHSNGVQLVLKPIAPGRSMNLIYSTQHCSHSHHKDPATDTCKHFYNGFEKKSSLPGDIFLSVALNVCLHIHYSL